MNIDTASSGPHPLVSAAAVAALHQGRKIDAIRITRQEQGIGLKEAKEAVDDYLRSQPGLQSSLANAQSQGTRTLLLWAVAVAAIAFLAVRFLPMLGW